jgi:L-rhamnose mutarotase
MFGTTAPRAQKDKNRMKRYGMVLGLRSEKLEEYKRYHTAVWPGVLKKIKECNIQNYSIFLRQLDDGRHYLFSYFEYTGSDFAADMAKMAADETTQRWWAINKPCQQPLEGVSPDAWWAEMEEVFHYA